jgi:hypothetical protein
MESVKKEQKSLLSVQSRGKLSLEDLKSIPDIQSKLWGPLLGQGIIKLVSVLQQTLIKH